MEFTEIIKVIWHDMVTTPCGSILGVVIIILFLFKDQFKDTITLLVKRQSQKYEKSEYSRKDVINHPIIRNLDYWVETGVDLVKIEKSYAKELIMKDVLKLKFTVIKEVLLDYLNNKLTGDISQQDLKKFFTEFLRDIDAKQLLGWRSIGIPEIFIKKYLIVQQVGNEVVQNSVRVFLSDAITASGYTKVYLILSILDAHLTNIYTNVVSTALSLNGDLNGIIYKGVVIGSNNTFFAVDAPVSKDLVESRLNALINKTKAARAGVVLFHAFSGMDAYSGKFSVVYDSCSPGVESDRADFQHMPAYLLSDLQEPFDNDKMVIGSITDFSYGLHSLMSKHGTEVLVCYPIKNLNNVKGFIKLDWMSKTKYKDSTSSIDLEKELKNSAEDIKNLLSGYINENIR